MTEKDKRRVALNKAKKKYEMVTKKVRANGTVSVSGPQLKSTYVRLPNDFINSDLKPAFQIEKLFPRTGSTGMKRSAHYPMQFCREVAKHHLKHMDTQQC